MSVVKSLIKKWVEERKDSSAVVMGNNRMTYSELNKRSNQLANFLLHNGLNQCSEVCILMDRGPEFIISLLGCLKAGMVFVPFDPDFPEERLKIMATTVANRWWIVKPEYLELLKKIFNEKVEDQAILILSAKGEINESKPEKTNIYFLSNNEVDEEPEVTIFPENPLYIFFTSGSTGKPKGIVGCHKGLDHFVRWEIETLHLTPKDRVSQLTTPSFDAVLRDIFVPLAAGATICIPEKKEIILNPDLLVKWIERDELTLIHCVPSLFRQILRSVNENIKFEKLRYLLMAGEPIRVADISKWYEYFGERIQLVNLYGSTETTMVKLYHFITSNDLARKTISIGRPMKGAKAIILDDNMKICPPGVEGEIFIRSPYLTLGYYKEPKKTKEVFVPNPFSQDKKDYIYKTGDLGRYLPDGTIEFIGRRDEQVKIRGNRVEIREVERVLETFSGIKEVAIIPVKDKNDENYLKAFLVMNTDSKEVTISDFKRFLKKYLPQYMIPKDFIKIDKMPLTPNGKIDKEALKKYEHITDFNLDMPYVPPRTKTEKILAKIFEEVLGKKQIGIYDNFFESGGHSLNAAQVTSRIFRELKVEIPLREFFNNPTIIGINKLIKKYHRKNFYGIEKGPNQPYYPVSHSQRRLWILSQIDEDLNAAYNIPLVFFIEGALNIEKFEKAFQFLVEKHSILKTFFSVQDGEPCQMVYEGYQFRLTYENNGVFACQDDMEQYILSEAYRPFDLTKPGLVRAILHPLAKDRHLFIFVMHHIITDGWSMNLIFKEVTEIYEHLITTKNYVIKPLPIQYSDYCVWQRKMLANNFLGEEKEYWLNKFKGDIPVLNLPTDFPRRRDKTYKGETHFFVIDFAITSKLKNMARQFNTTVFSILFSIYIVLLYRYSGQEDIITGIPVHGRIIPELEELIGFFVNTLAIRTEIIGDEKYKDFLAKVQANLVEAFDNQNYPIDLLIEDLNLTRDSGLNPLFDNMFVFQNTPGFVELGKEISGLKFNPVKTGKRYSRQDLAINLMEGESGLIGYFEYSTELFAKETIIGFEQSFKNLLTSAIDDPKQSLNQLEILSIEEKKRLVKLSSGTISENKVKVLNQFVEEMANRIPDKPALILDGKKLTFKELNDYGNCLARHLCRKGIKQGSIVALLFQRSFEMIISLLGVLKAGGAYIPIAEDYPSERVNYILKDAGVNLVLTQKNFTGKITEHNEVMTLDMKILDALLVKKDEIILPQISPHDLAYIIYTSGSTGQPKGVMIEHKSIINSVTWKINEFDYAEGDKLIQLLSWSFDGGQFEIWVSLAAGMTMVMMNSDHVKEISTIIELIDKYQINHFFAVPALYYSILTYPGIKSLSSIKTVTLGGERVSQKLVQTHQKINSQAMLINEYGPTETAVLATYYVVSEKSSNIENIPIGRPIANAKVYILDKNLNPVPQGVTGEIFIGGIGVGRGYLNNESLTTEKFISHPFFAGERIYRTGDLGRYLHDGNIEFIGRIDHQVKIRGYRVEIGEIEANLLTISGVKDCAVLPHNLEDNSILVAYIVPEKNSNLSSEIIRCELQKILPQYMIPSTFIFLDSLPLTSTGKVDRKALPGPEGFWLNERQYLAPAKETEKIIAATWSEVLGIKKIGLKDNFFELGGDSIKAIQITARLNSQGINLRVKDILSYQTIERISLELEKEKKSEKEGNKKVEGQLPLTAIQKWFFTRGFKYPEHWNQSLMLDLTPSVDINILIKVLKAIFEYHDTLRLYYSPEKEVLIYNNDYQFEPEIYSLIHLKEEEKKKSLKEFVYKVKSGFDLTRGPLFKAVFFELGENERKLLLTAHHLIIDGVSWRIIISDLLRGYDEYLQKGQISFGAKTSSFKEWAEKIHQYSQSEQLLKEVSYWQEVVETDFTLPHKNQRGENLEKDRVTLFAKLERDKTELLLTKIHNAYNTGVVDILLTSLAITFQKFTNRDEIIINLEQHGREDLFRELDITGTVGWFTAEFPLKIVLPCDYSPADAIKMVKEELRKVPGKGIGYGILKYLTGIWGEISKDDIQILFNYLGEFELLRNNGLFKIGDALGFEKSPLNQHVSELDITCLVTEGQLYINLNYNQNRFSQKTMQKLLDDFVTNLKNLITFCSNPENKGYTPADFDLVQLTQEFLETVDKNDIEDIYPLSPMQEGMLYHYLKESTKDTYFEQASFSLEGTINPEIFEKAWKHVVLCNEVLRTVFDWKNYSIPLQMVKRNNEFKIIFKDLRREKKESIPLLLEKIKEDDRKEGFILESKPPIRVILCWLDEKRYEIILSFHHLLMDGWCTGILLSEFFETYHQLALGLALPQYRKNRFKEYIRYLKDQQKESARNYWREYLKDFTEPAYIQSAIFAKKDLGDTVFSDIDISSELSNDILQFAKKYRLTINTILQLAWGLLVQKYTQREDVVFGTTVSGRPADLMGVEKIVGLFINTVPVRIKIDGKDSVIDMLNKISKDSIERNEYEYLPLVDIIAENIKGYSGLFDNILVFENYPFNPDMFSNITDWKIVDYNSYSKSNYNLNVIGSFTDNLRVKIMYNSGCFSKDTIKRMGEHLKNILTKIIKNPDNKVRAIEMLSEDEKHLLLYSLNETETDFNEKTINELVRRWVQRTPTETAIIAGDKKLTYAELDELSNCLAYHLRELGVSFETFVGILVESSFEMVVGMLAVLKAGGVYLPITPDYPIERINFILNDSNARLVLTTNEFTDKLRNVACEIVTVDELKFELNNYQSSKLPEVKPDNLAYIIYTSGTTGEPKGVMIEHRSIANSIQWKINEYNYSPGDKVIQLLSYSFDGAQFEIWVPLAAGIALVLPEAKRRSDLREIIDVIKKERITHFTATPSLYHNLLSHLDEKPLESVKCITLAGEKLSYKLWEEHNRLQSHIKLINEYGPTEAAVVTTFFDTSKVNEETKIIPIGKPISNMRVYILDENLRPLTIGVVGEIYIGGIGLARGYVNNPQLTKEKFLPDPFRKNERIYKTGDRGCYLEDGNIEFVDRVDNQVKIRGYRIEPGEIEAKLIKHKKVKEAVVVDRKVSDGLSLLAYVTLSEKDEISDQELKDFLKEYLPSFMIPDRIICLENLPLTPNGKIDRKLLARRVEEEREIKKVREPRNEVEKKLIMIWQELLETEMIGIDDNFFELGGHSLKATRMVARIYKEFSVECPIDMIFEYPTIAQISEIILQSQKIDYEYITPLPKQKYYPVSHAQKRLWVLEQFEESKGAYNIPSAWILAGELEVELLEKAFNKVIERHEILRTSFEMMDDELVQTVDENYKFAFDLSKELISVEEIEEILQKEGLKPFDLTKPGLFRVGLFKLADDKHLLFITIHHIIFDGWSMNVLLRELSYFYTAYSLDIEPSLPPLKIQYRDYAGWQNNLLNSEKMKKQEKYWLEEFKGELPILNLPTDYKRPAIQTFKGDDLDFIIDGNLTNNLKQLALKEGVTSFMVLMAAYNVLLYHYTGQDDLIVGTPIAGRPHQDLENMLGFFVNSLAIRTKIKKDASFMDFLGYFKEKVLLSFNNQDYPFDILVEKLDLNRDLSRSPLFDTMFVFQNIYTGNGDIGETIGELSRKLQMIPVKMRGGISKYDLSMTIGERDGELTGNINYNIDLFKRETIERMVGHYREILKNIVAGPLRKITEIDMLTDKEKDMLLHHWVGKKVEYPDKLNLTQIFDQYAELYPDRVAVICEDKKLTYEKLRMMSDKLAAYLKRMGIGVEDLVGIMVGRSIEVAIAIPGVLKAGGAYLPIDENYPPERISYLLKDSKAKALITVSEYVGLIPEDYDGEIIFLDREEIFQQVSDLEIYPAILPENLAYVIYTSGSTGEPKGVMVEHKNLLNEYYNGLKILKLEEFTPKLLQLLSHSFDVFQADLCRSIYCGGTMVIASAKERVSPEDIYRLIKTHEINILTLTPSLMNIVLEFIRDNELSLDSMRWVLLGGEPLYQRDYELILKKSRGKFNVVNCYGLTETTIDSTFYIQEESVGINEIVPLGKALPNIEVYILDSAKNPVPVGVKGEIYIGGYGVSRGYLNRPGLKAERFLAHPFSADKNAKIFKTGDLGRWLADGNIEFCGRVDEQVKIRGYRIEPGEIKATLLKHPLIKDAYVTVIKGQNGINQLACYIALNTGVEMTEVEVKAYLAQRLPQYMLPLYYIFLSDLPLTPNGKVDTKALPLPVSESKGRKPGNEVERKIAEIWGEVLGIREVGVDDNFFESGGSSLKMIKLMLKLNKTFGVNFTLSDLMERPTIALLAQKISKGEGFSDRCLVKLRDGSGRLNLFCIHPGSGEVLCYEKLARLIDERFTVYGIKARRKPPQTLEEMISVYLEQIKAVQKAGPYYLLGHSLGGNIAYELALRLEANGDSIGKLLLLDSLSFSEFNSLPPLEEQLKLMFIMDIKNMGVEDFNDLNIAELQKLSLDQFITAIHQQGFLKGTEYDNLDLREIEKLYKNRGQLISLVKPPQSIIDSDIFYIQAKESVKTVNIKGWQNWTKGKVTYIIVDGNHNTLLQLPYVKETAKEVNRILNISE